jgi:hypothetical protein
MTISGYPNNSLQQDFTLTENIEQGFTYRVMYRTMNQIGWSEWSDITYILAAQPPSIPDRPELGVITSTDLQLMLQLSLDNGGSDILSYTLEYTDGSTPFASLLTYTEATSTQLVPIHASNANSLIPGKIYFFRSYATNAIGNSVSSGEIIVAASQIPDQATAPVWVSEMSSSNSITVSWLPVADKEIPT